MTWRHPPGAVHGGDGRIAYADQITSRLYASLTPEARTRVRAMIEGTHYRESITLSSGDTSLDLKSDIATITTSDCVVSTLIEFANGRRITQSEMLVPAMPETVRQGLIGRDMADVTGLEVLRGIPVRWIEEAGDKVRLRYSYDTCTLVDPA